MSRKVDQNKKLEKGWSLTMAANNLGSIFHLDGLFLHFVRGRFNIGGRFDLGLFIL